MKGPGLRYLKNLKSLEELSLAETPLEDSAFEYLADLTGLKRVWLDGSHVTGIGCERLAGLPNQAHWPVGHEAERYWPKVPEPLEAVERHYDSHSERDRHRFGTPRSNDAASWANDRRRKGHGRRTQTREPPDQPPRVAASRLYHYGRGIEEPGGVIAIEQAVFANGRQSYRTGHCRTSNGRFRI